MKFFASLFKLLCTASIALSCLEPAHLQPEDESLAMSRREGCSVLEGTLQITEVSFLNLQSET